ncbi:DNA methyltransferase [Umboniibacter marinipuniceus]|uniref:site-specific DNA-methyltransferase (adenine-specific) n=1 Tax=Umboniibacter marinipuniceus TaxID=569599 RepID=A0A3M0AC18_9GAMM|nr:DNA methyltransferase [Umboniibacter marinipuniceus]RMA82713.1 type II restriction/modification system DNA methylase subunit YeeA [Umboniibacter marinipuniceus]
MNITQIEENVRSLLNSMSSGDMEQSDFIYELLLAYGHRKQSVTRLRSGERNLSAKDNSPRHDEIIWKRHLYFKQVEGDALHTEIDQMRKEKLVTTNKIRFVIVTNFDQLLAVDTKTSDSLDINLNELPKQFDFFLPWAGMEKAVYQGENPADIKAAEKMAKLFDLIKGDNFDESNKDDTEALHNLNVFLTRLLFCFFAEDTEIFADNQFSRAIESHTKDDGSDLPDYLNRLFSVLNTADGYRGELPDYLASFPYVNGGLFADDILSPVFSAKARRMLIECGSELDWSDINPDIFGSMIQAVVHPDQRGGMGMHYTSVSNIMKVIEPLFLNDFYEELEKVENSATKLHKLQQRLGEIKIFDPACGSGNFLIIAYKELRKLEMEVLKRLQELYDEKQDLKSGVMAQVIQPFSVIKLSQFYGIELDDFAHEVAILSLWLAEHQMNVEFKTEFGEVLPSLPLQKGGSIICANATRIEWTDVCSNKGEIYILGNPPYLGHSLQSKDQKNDIEFVFQGTSNYKKQDYISCWFYKAAYFINKESSFSFVTTNSLCQGAQVEILWPKLYEAGVEIGFAHKSFKWSNNARRNAGVICSIIGMRHSADKVKRIYYQGVSVIVGNINSYLVDSLDTIVVKATRPISDLPKMTSGNKPLDGGYLVLSPEEKECLLEEAPNASKFVRRFIGSSEYIRGNERWCLWISDDERLDAESIDQLKRRFDKVREVRLNGGNNARNKADSPHKFEFANEPDKSQIIVPRVSSERREYIPVGYLDNNVVIADSAQVLFDPDPYVFSLINSKMHMVWVDVTAGRLKSDYRYSSQYSYHTFPVPTLSESDKNELKISAMNILSARANYPEKTLAKLYDPNEMPKGLRAAHEENDRIVDSIYRKKEFINDDERLAVLFELYKKMTGGQNA